jgi:dienelactone hydrolase
MKDTLALVLALVAVHSVLARGALRGEGPALPEGIEEPPPITALEPLAGELSLERAARYLDAAAIHWQKTKKCGTCHTNFAHLLARPALAGVSAAPSEVRAFFENMVGRGWKEEGPRWDAEVVVAATTLAWNDRATTGVLHPRTREALERMASLQREDGGWEWLKCGWPPMESDDHFGVTFAAVGLGAAPGGYAASEGARRVAAGIRRYLAAHPPPSLHHRAMVLWASCRLEGLLEREEKEEILAQLLALQRPDGGWALASLLEGWKEHKRKDEAPQETERSDGYGTGFVVFVAREAGLAASDPRLARGIAWLETYQRRSGRWFTPSPTQDSKHFITNYGTAFAVLALAACGKAPVSAAQPAGPTGTAAAASLETPAGALPGTDPLALEGDIASELVAGIDRFLLREIDAAAARRARRWEPEAPSPEARARDMASRRARLAHRIGLRDARPPMSALELLETTARPARVGRGESHEIYAARWPAFGDVHGEGLLLVPLGRRPVADVVAVPDADQTPEEVAGLVDGAAPESQFARRLAESGCRVLVPALVSRARDQHGLRPHWPHTKLTHREFLHRSAFELGRHLVGYEAQKVLAALDWFHADPHGSGARAEGDPAGGGAGPVAGDPAAGVIGWGEGGLIALHAAALDERLDAACVSGYFDDRRNVWQEPIERNVFGLLEEFADAELAAMVAPRALVIEAARAPEAAFPSEGGAPGRLVTPRIEDVRREVERARRLVRGLEPAARIELVESGGGAGPPGSEAALAAFLRALAPGAELAPAGGPPLDLREADGADGADGAARTDGAAARLARQVLEIDRHNQDLLRESPYVRAKFLERLDTSSVEAYERSSAEYRRFFYDEVIGRFEAAPLPPRPRSRKAYDTEKWRGYEVVLDVFPDVIAYGILLLPKDLQDGERRPVVVCQHGLEGRPQDVVAGDHGAYHDFAAKLAERGFITFAPQNPYIFRDRFRTLQRKANPIGKTLFSIITAQHQEIVDWLGTLPWVDPERIAFYGLSYGGKTAMRVPALVTGYALSIASADFNEWVWKNASTRSPYSYVWTGEYEIFEFDLGSTFNYAEMAALICPRPFMVERGHFDGVAPDEAVGWEFAKVRHLYAGRLQLGERCEIEWFYGKHRGVHTINGEGTFAFLHKHLRWPEAR